MIDTVEISIYYCYYYYWAPPYVYVTKLEMIGRFMPVRHGFKPLLCLWGWGGVEGGREDGFSGVGGRTPGALGLHTSPAHSCHSTHPIPAHKARKMVRSGDVLLSYFKRFWLPRQKWT